MTSSNHGTVRYGYKASAEQFPPRQLVDFGISAEKHGFDIVAVSDHFQPWRHHGGHAPNSLVYLAALGERTERVALATSVLTPTLRYQPAFAQQAAADYEADGGPNMDVVLLAGTFSPQAYLGALGSEAAALDLPLGDATWDDDDYPRKLELVLGDPPAAVQPAADPPTACGFESEAVWTGEGADAPCASGDVVTPDVGAA